MYSSIYPQPTIVSGSKNKSDIKFPEDMQVILRADRSELGNLYIGNIEAAENKTIIENLQIGAILCVAKSYATKHPKELVKFTKYAPVEQSENAEIGQHLDECVNFIAEKLKITNVLIHCVAGTNRSACFAIAFLIKFRSLSLEDAYNEVKSRRKIICPSDNMVSQLKKYEKTIISKKNPIIQVQEVRFNQPSFIEGEKSIRIKTNMFDRSNFLDIEDNKSLNNSKMSNRIKVEDIDQRKSCRTNKSCYSKMSNGPKINISINEPRNTSKNPQESFISRQSKAVPSALNRSFCPSQRNKSQISQISQLPSQLKLTKKASSSREQFTQKVKHLDSKNYQINEKINFIQEKFEHDHQSHRLALEMELNEICQLRSNINTQMSERKSKLSERRQVHDKTMQNREVQEYLSTLPLNTVRK